jgi:hypothetical protein
MLWFIRENIAGLLVLDVISCALLASILIAIYR